MADTTTLFYPGEMASLGELQTTCNTEEMNLERNLQSLDTVLNDGKKVTEAVYKATDPENLGSLTIKAFSAGEEANAAFRGKAFILTQPVDVLVFK
jgi:hypothetical protein